MQVTHAISFVYAPYRIMGLTGIVKTECGDVDRIIFYPRIRWSVFVNPGILLILYWFFALNTLLWRSKMEVSSYFKACLFYKMTCH